MTGTTYHYFTVLTNAGALSILPTGGEGTKLMLGDTHLGDYKDLQEAFEAAVMGQTKVDHGVQDWHALDVPGDLDNWTKKVFAHVSRLRPA